MDIQDILAKLKEPLPERAVSAHRENPKKKFVEVDWYEYWADQCAGALYRIEERESEINMDKGYVKVVIRVHIGDVFRDGKGVRVIDNNGLENAVDRATSEATRNAFDKYFMGWHNLGKYAVNRIIEPEDDSSTLTCIKCTESLSTQEWQDLNKKYPKLNSNNPYHERCLPSFLKK